MFCFCSASGGPRELKSLALGEGARGKDDGDYDADAACSRSV